MTKLEKLYSIIECSALPLATNGTQELEEGIIKEEILPALDKRPTMPGRIWQHECEEP